MLPESTPRFTRMATVAAVAAITVLYAVAHAASPAMSYLPEVFGQSDSVRPRPATGHGAGVSGMQIQNLSQDDPAQVWIDYYKQLGGPPVSVSPPLIPPLATFTDYLPQDGRLRGAFSVIVAGDRYLAALARTEWPDSGGAVLYSNPIPSVVVRLPLAMRRFAGQTSLVSIQNTDANQQVPVLVKLYPAGSAVPLLTKEYAIEKGTSITLDLDNPDSTLPIGFLGSLTVESYAPLAVQSVVYRDRESKALYAFEGMPDELADRAVYAPLVRNGHTAQRLTTGIVAMNTGNGPANVTLTIQLSGGTTVAPPTCRACQVTIRAGETHVWYAPSIPEMPTGTYGAAFLQSDQPLAVVANEISLSGTADSAAYSGLKADWPEDSSP